MIDERHRLLLAQARRVRAGRIPSPRAQRRLRRRRTTVTSTTSNISAASAATGLDILRPAHQAR
jgi:hypothetical protein